MHRRHLVPAVFIIALSILVAMLAAATVAPRSAHASPIADKKAKLKAVKQQVEALDMRLELAVEQYNLASSRLAEVQQQVRVNEQELAEAQLNLSTARALLSRRVVSLYKQRDTDFLDVLLSTKSFDDLVSQLDLMQRIGESDSDAVDSIEKLKKEIDERRVQLLADKKQAETLVSQRAGVKQDIESSLAQRKQMVGGLEDEIKKMEAAAARAAQLAAQRAAAAAASASTGSAPANVAGGSTGSHSTSGSHPEVVAIARRYLGVPYVYAGASPSGFDCSGLVMYVYAKIGISLPHFAAWQYTAGTPIARDAIQPGDLVFFGSPIHHVGIYAGGGQMIHAPYTGAVVSYSAAFRSDLTGISRP